MKEEILTDKSSECENKLRAFSSQLLKKEFENLLKSYNNDIEIFRKDIEKSEYDVKNIITERGQDHCMSSLLQLHYELKGLRQILQINKKNTSASLQDIENIITTGDIILIKNVYSPRYVSPETYIHQYSDIVYIGNRDPQNEFTISREFGFNKKTTFTNLKNDFNDTLISQILILRPKKNKEKFKNLMNQIQDLSDYSHFLYAENASKSFSSVILTKLAEANIKTPTFRLKLDDEKKKLFKIDYLTGPFLLQYSKDIEVVEELISSSLIWDHYIEEFMNYMFLIKDEVRFIHNVRQEYSRIKKENVILYEKMDEKIKNNAINNEVFRYYINNALESLLKTQAITSTKIKTKHQRFLDFVELGYPHPLR